MKVCVFQPLTVDLDVKPIIILGESNYQKEQKIEKQKQEELKKRTVIARERNYNSNYEIVDVDYTNDCVTWVKNKTGIDRTIGNGARLGIQGHEPRIGAIGSLKRYVHAVLITEVDGNEITFEESHYRTNLITRRTLNISEFLGFIYN
jgi:hypothetical protein